jgi:DNA-binding GntR family transcriptional regulator
MTMPKLAVSARRVRRSLADEVSDLIASEFILSGAVAPGELLPSEKDLAERYSTSRITIRQSLRTLREAGLIRVRHGVGSTVLPRTSTLDYGLDRLGSLDTFAREAGGEVLSEDVEFEETTADESLADALELEPGHPVLEIRRAKSYKGIRVAWLTDFVPEGTLPFETVRREFSGSVLDVLMQNASVGVDHADLEIRAVTLDPAVAKRLQVEPGAPALFMDEVVFDLSGRAIERGIGWHLQEHRRFVLRRRRQIGF